MGPLLAYDAAGNVVATLAHLVARDAAGDVTGLVDFAAIEAAGRELTEVWNVDGATGSGTWPEWLGMRAHEFRVLRAGGRIIALVHKTSGHRRERAAIEAAIAERILAADGKPADLRDLLGGPDRPLRLDAEGRTVSRLVTERPPFPVLRAMP